MSIPFEKTMLICEGHVENVFKENVHLAIMKLETDVISFTGISAGIKNHYKNDDGYHCEIPTSKIARVYPAKAGMFNLTAIETYDEKYYEVIDADGLSTFGKKSARQVLDLLTSFLSRIVTCPKCGKALVSSGMKFCGNCGEQLPL